MNSAFGEPTAETLPFDLRHLRKPITYNLGEDDRGRRNVIFEELVRELVNALRLILGNTSLKATTEFVPRDSGGAGLFLTSWNDLIPDVRYGRCWGNAWAE